jgi:anti-anti-sigma regulatory factor
MWRGQERRCAVKVMHIGAPRGSGDLVLLRDRLGSIFADGGADVLVCDLGELADADCATVDGLARLQLAARRLGARLRLVHASPQLHRMLALAGLCDVVGVCGDLGLEAAGKAEEREHARGVEEERDPADPIA